MNAQDELLRQLWRQVEAWRQWKVKTAHVYEFWSTEEAQIVDTLDKLKQSAVDSAQRS